MKRQRGRNRGGGGGGGKPQQHNANRAFDSNGPDGVKVRGNAQHVFEKYQQLARDATSAGDRVLAENYLQHAEHYFRLLRAIQPQRPAAEILGRDQFASGYDIDFEDEGVQAQAEAADENDTQGESRGENRDGEGRNRDRDRDRDGNRDRGEWQGRDRDRDGERRDDRNRDGERRDGEGRQGRRDRWRDRRDRDDRPRGEGEERRDGERREREPNRDRGDRPERDPLTVIEPQGDARPEPREERGAVLRDAEGGESHAPAFLQARAEPKAETAEGEKPARRRRRPRSFEAGEAPGGETEEA
ncbi:DUF4167 domain-containing protein [Phenylobacterium sp. VNQ135]|uniref:DUF4167 domain-containing protein n=1 Tax=Phenylobacterium sp. VNQ135 TaxID=3400922 RepID=UPI003C01C9D7